MRVCSKTSCSCTVATCYNLTASENTITFTNIDTGSTQVLPLVAVQHMVNMRKLRVGKDEFSPNALNKIHRFLEAL